MFFKTVLSLLLSISISFVTANEYEQVGNFINIYKSISLNSSTVLSYKNNTVINTDSDNNNDTIKTYYYETNVGFSNGKKDNNIFNKHVNISQDECFKKCKNHIKCLGVFEYYNTSQEIHKICNLLYKIEKPIFYNETTFSWLKVNEKTFNDDTSYKIIGNLYDSYEINEPSDRHYNNSKIYIDLNHNGVLDEDEPFLVMRDFDNDYYEFVFDNLSAGTYLVRQEIPQGCYQLYPGVYGNYLDYYYHGNGFIDRVIYHYFYSHYTKARPHGGKVGSNKLIANVDYSYILGNNHIYYFTFYPDNIIIFSFVDETIIDTEGDDIFISTYGISKTKADIYVSHNNDDYYFLGVLNTQINKTSFDLSNTLENYPVSYIKLEFFIDGDLTHDARYEGLNLVSIRGEINSLYEPSYAYYVKLTPENNRDYVIFYNDCHYLASCDLYCYFNLFTENEIQSCLYGCRVFDTIKNCNCNQDEVPQVKFNGSYFDYRNCHLGCYQNMREYVDGNYTLIPSSKGYDVNQLVKINNCSSNCLNVLINECSGDNECNAFSVHNNYPSNHIHGHTYSLPYYQYNNNYNLFVKNDYLHIAYHTTTETITSITSSTLTSITSLTSTSTLTSSTLTSSTLTSSTLTSSTRTSSTSSTTSMTSTSSSTTSSMTSTSSTSSTSTTSSITSTTSTISSTTSSSNTKTSSTITSFTITSLINLKSKNNNKESKRLLVVIPLFTILGLLLVGMIISGILYYIKKKNNYRIQTDGNTVSFDNPAYNRRSITTHLNDNEGNTSPGPHYVEVDNKNIYPSYNVDDLYNEVDSNGDDADDEGHYADVVNSNNDNNSDYYDNSKDDNSSNYDADKDYMEVQ